MPYQTLWLTGGRQNGRYIAPFGSLLRHILGFSAYFVFGITFAHIYSVGPTGLARKSENKIKTNKNLRLWERLLVLIWVQPTLVYL